METGSGKKKLCDMMKSHQEEQSLYAGDVGKCWYYLSKGWCLFICIILNTVVEVKEFNAFEVLLHLIAPRTKQTLLSRFEVKYFILCNTVLRTSYVHPDSSQHFNITRGKVREPSRKLVLSHVWHRGRSNLWAKNCRVTIRACQMRSMLSRWDVGTLRNTQITDHSWFPFTKSFTHVV